jgi:hypothetical protein
MDADLHQARPQRSDGFVELVDERQQPVGARQACQFEWDLSPDRATIRLLTDHDFVFAAAEGAVCYITIRNRDGELMCMLRLPERVVGTGIFGVGPHRSGLVPYRRMLP